ncbi:MAG TPA: DoxX family protein [Sphingobacteriaceae bacterium]
MRSRFLSSESLSPDYGLLLLRLMAGACVFTHGWQKIQNIMAGNFQFGDPVGLGPEVSLYLSAFAEGLCSILIILGLVTRLATIPLIINFAVAFFIAHQADEFNIKELPLIYLTIFLTLFFTGPGKLSLDRRIFG